MPIQVPWASTPSLTPSNSQCGSSGHLRHSTRAGRGTRRRYVVGVAVPSYEQVLEAADLISPWVRRTPVIDVEVDGRPVALKLEQLQHTGSFKVRGAFTSVLTAAERPTSLVAASGGNHGLAVAYVGRALGLPARIFVPATAPALKVRAIADFGAEVNAVGDTYAEALVASREAGEEPGARVLHAYDAPGTVTGQGTVGLEIAQQVPDADTVLVAVGGGGLVSGVTLGLDGAADVMAIEPESCATAHTALHVGRPVDVAVGGVAADALGASRLGDIAFSVVSDHGVRSLLVTDEAIVAARQWLWRHVRLAVEPAGATALAALLSGAYVPGDAERVCLVVCGANADPSTL
ncbi:MAG: threonine/serine dehydratase [Marmoricola sp.]|nr:threonine/serine dehydratase [Marmoricola sp.]